MDRPEPDIELRDVERDIDAGFRMLRFAPHLERQFETDVGPARCRHMMRQNVIGLVIYHCFLISDYRAIGDVFELDLFVHAFVMTPVMLLINVVLSRHPPVRVREGLQMTGLVILTTTIVFVSLHSRMPDRDIVHFTLALVVAFATAMQRIRFWYVLAGCAVVLALYLAGLMAMTPFSADRTIMSASMFLGLVVFSLVASYNLEHESRMGYLLTLRDRFRNRELEIASRKDALTGIGNRRALDTVLTGLTVRHTVDPRRPTSILLLDIDHFKLFNDTNGHQAGDRCLKRVADLLVADLRGLEDAIYRFGGEEFLILLDGAGLAEAVAIAERLRSAVEAARIPVDASSGRFVTVSIGVGSGCFGGDAAPQAVIASADLALYAAKHEGRNRVSPLLTARPAETGIPNVRRLAG